VAVATSRNWDMPICIRKPRLAFQNRLTRAGESYVKIPDAGAANVLGIVGPNVIVSAAGATDWGQSAKTPSVSPPAT
jgi:hypothetical protein